MRLSQINDVFKPKVGRNFCLTYCRIPCMDSAICILWRIAAIEGGGREINGLNEYFWGKMWLVRVLVRNNWGTAAQQVGWEACAGREFRGGRGLIRQQMGEERQAGAWKQACRLAPACRRCLPVLADRPGRHERCRRRRPEGNGAERSETHGGAGRAAEEASRTKRARFSRSESVSPRVVALEELVKPNQGERFNW
jgi:hypothetical protein